MNYPWSHGAHICGPTGAECIDKPKTSTANNPAHSNPNNDNIKEISPRQEEEVMQKVGGMARGQRETSLIPFEGREKTQLIKTAPPTPARLST